MAQPNSLLTIVRRWLALKIHPFPDVGEAWCVNCAVNGGKTTIISAMGMEHHINAHDKNDIVRIEGLWIGGEEE